MTDHERARVTLTRADPAAWGAGPEDGVGPRAGGVAVPALPERPGGVGNAMPVVIIAEGEANGLQFSYDVLRRAVGRFEGAPVFVDHAAPWERGRPGGRSVRDLVGLITEARADAAGKRLTARLSLHREADWLRGLIAAFGDRPQVLGLSADLYVRVSTPGPSGGAGSVGGVGTAGAAERGEGYHRPPVIPVPVAPSTGPGSSGGAGTASAITGASARRVMAIDAVNGGQNRWLTAETPCRRVLSIDAVNSVDIVVHPAAGGRFLGAERGQNAKEEGTMNEDRELMRVQAAGQEVASLAVGPEVDDDVRRDSAEEDTGALAGALRRELVEARLARSRLPEPLKGAARALANTRPSGHEALEAVADFERRWADATTQDAIRGLGAVRAMRTGLERIELAFERLMGLPETAAHRDAERLSGIRELYDLLTGDWERHGVYHPERVLLANATTSTMAQVVANVLNKVMLTAYGARQWWKPMVHEEDFASMRDPKWITLGGFADLDTVTEGNAYTEKAWDDYAETASFVKKGNYIGVTLEMIDRDDVAAVRAIPRRLGTAANRTLSAAIAALFTANSGVGPTLADTKALFHTDHGNLGTSALEESTWKAAVQAMFKQGEFHSSKRLGIRPAFCLVPIELESTAVEMFTTTLEPGLAGNTRAIQGVTHSVITVPEWTDANDWAAVADPADLEGVCVGYRFGRGPEIFVADGDLMGAMFTNDEMRVKVRFVYAVGIGDYRALYKANVSA